MEKNTPATPEGQELAEPAQGLRGQLLSLLESCQNQDGGWGFRAAEESRVEPTAWALQALTDAERVPPSSVHRAIDFLKARQLSDGSWPATGGMTSGSWVTSLACVALARRDAEPHVVEAGRRWLCDDYPRDSSRWQKILGRLGAKKRLVAHNDEFR